MRNNGTFNYGFLWRMVSEVNYSVDFSNRSQYTLHKAGI